MRGNSVKFAGILTKIKDFGAKLRSCGKGGPSGSPRFGDQRAHHMTDSTGSIHSLAGLLEAEATDIFDWDPSALADWPNIPAAANFIAVPQAGDA
jgi:hypothetical protein